VNGAFDVTHHHDHGGQQATTEQAERSYPFEKADSTNRQQHPAIWLDVPDPVFAGRIDYQCANSAPAIPQIEGKLVKPIAILGKGRSRSLPALASAHEQGLANFEAVNWNAIFLPRGTPDTIVRKLHDAVIGAMNTPVVEQRMKEVGADLVEPQRRSAEYLAGFVASEIEKWAAPIKAAGMSGVQ
jgi:tripartite-type tricarboxylate transporter receptor subunit TctC